ncbi:MAG: thioredoxin domain-containing protein [Actinomycetota bacterium]
MSNRLADETSPYLLQHKDNPVDWYPWGPDAVERARAEDKPILLSIGYTACHWCHVMEHESFEDPETARLMNEHFVSIKVDREERPDIDSIYMEAVQAMTGHGGWPMTVFLTPEGVPFYGGTYFPPDDRHGMPSFGSVLRAVAEAWRERRPDITAQGARLVDHIGAGADLRASSDPVSEDLVDEAFTGLRVNFDPEYGGFGGAPKFPQPATVDFLLRLAARGHEEAAHMATRTLDAMAAGGMFDQLAGGFARYSVDRFWLVPHFEKMLYDNAQLLRTYTRSWQETGSNRHKEVAESTAAWMLGEMRDPAGGFWSSLDADSEGEEGKFYAFSLDEVRTALGDDADAAIEMYGLTRAGNFEGRNIPVHASSGLDSETRARVRARLLEYRNQRVRPGTDTKVLTAWNGLAISALAEAGAVLGRDDWIAAAIEAMDFVLTRLRIDTRLMRSYRKTENGDEIVKHLGYCEDYAYVLEACLQLYEATFNIEFLTEARWAADECIRLFEDDKDGGFFTTAIDAERLVTRPKELVDGAMPAANSVLALELQRLDHFTGDHSYSSRALPVLKLTRDAMLRAPSGFGHMLGAADFYASNPAEIVLVGEPDAPDTADLIDCVHRRFRPNKVLICASESDESAARTIPLLQGRSRLSGRATAYVCRNGTCRLPVDDPDALAEQLG